MVVWKPDTAVTVFLTMSQYFSCPLLEQLSSAASRMDVMGSSSTVVEQHMQYF